MISPARERVLDLRLVARAIVDAGGALTMPAVMIETRLDVMRFDSEVVHARRYGAPDVVKGPRRHGVAQTLVEHLLPASPCIEADARGDTEHMIPVGARHRLDDLNRRRWQCGGVGAMVL